MKIEKLRAALATGTAIVSSPDCPRAVELLGTFLLSTPLPVNQGMNPNTEDVLGSGGKSLSDLRRLCVMFLVDNVVPSGMPQHGSIAQHGTAWHMAPPLTPRKEESWSSFPTPLDMTTMRQDWYELISEYVRMLPS
jgi:hypothetical protein